MHSFTSWWNSYEAFSSVGTWLKFLVAAVGVLILVVGLRENSLRKNAQAQEKLMFDGRLKAAETATKERRLTPQQKAELTTCLKAISNKQKVFISAGVFDGESVTFAEDIESVLIAAGFETYFPKGMQPDASVRISVPGAHIVVKDSESRNHPFAAKLQRCFKNAGITLLAVKSGDPKFQTDSVEIAIGQR